MGKQRKSTSKGTKADATQAGKGAPADGATRARMTEQAASLRRACRADAARFQGEIPDLTAVVGYWIGYPLFLEWIGFGCDWSSHQETVQAYQALNHVHSQATRILMKEAARRGLDPHALYECGRVIQEIYLADPQLCLRRTGSIADTWPEGMGAARYALPTGQQEALRAGEAVFIRLAVALEIADTPDMGAIKKAVAGKMPTLEGKGTGVARPSKPGGPPPEPQKRCTCMKKSEIAARILNRPSYKGLRPRKIQTKLDRCIIRDEGNGLWSIVLDPSVLSAAEIERLNMPEWPPPPKMK